MIPSRRRACTRRIALAASALVAVVAPSLWASARPATAPHMLVRHNKALGGVDVAEGDSPVLRYHFGTVAVPDRVKGRKYAEARSDYIHPLYGPAGEVLTADFPGDHPHHRGVYWAWPEVYYQGRKRDLHALQGVFARPHRLVRAEGGPAAAVVEAESIWKWGDAEPIVRERAILRAHKARADGSRWIDLEFGFTALVDGVAIARRNQALYGGLNLRTTLHGKQQILHHTDPPGARRRGNWGQIAGVPDGAKDVVAIAILEHPANPDYPGQWMQYPKIAWLQPTFPAKGSRFALRTDRPLVLRYRFWIRRGAATREQLAQAWEAYARTGPAPGARDSDKSSQREKPK